MKPTFLFACLLALASPAGAQEITPPQPVETPPAAAAEGTTDTGTVVLLVTVGADGLVRDVSVAQTAGPALDAAAVAAVMRWKFRPALRDGQPFEARVRIPFRFEAAPARVPSAPGTGAATLPGVPPPQPGPPQPAPSPPPVPSPSTSSQPTPAPSGPAVAPPVPPVQQSGQGEKIEEVTVRGYQRKVEYGASDFVIDVGQLAIIPRKNAENLLELAPGIFIANEGGECHAEQVFLRGFNAEQGQAIEFTVNGIPINEVDNPDSHGYADTHFIIPELI